MPKRSKPIDIMAARQAEALRRAAEGVSEDVPPEPEKEAPEEQDVGQIPYTLQDIFAAFGQAQWDIRLLNQQLNITRQQVRTYRNLVAELENKLKVASGAPVE